MAKNLEVLREKIDQIDDKLLELIQERFEIVNEVRKYKEENNILILDKDREKQIISRITNNYEGVMSKEEVTEIFKKIMGVSKHVQERLSNIDFHYEKKHKDHKTIIDVNGYGIGNDFSYMFGPCSIESEEQMEEVAKSINELGLKFIRGGAFKPRTSPYDFQGLGIDGLKLMKKIADKYNLLVVSEVMESTDLDEALKYIDVVQVGARNMQNFSFLKKLGKIDKPVLLKRGLSATINEFLNASEYILQGGNSKVILCDRGIRTFEDKTRNSLDIAGIAVIKRSTHLPVIVDISHAAGRSDIIPELAAAVKALGVDGLMCEVHPEPCSALSDANQQITPEEMKAIFEKINKV